MECSLSVPVSNVSCISRIPLAVEVHQPRCKGIVFFFSYSFMFCDNATDIRLIFRQLRRSQIFGVFLRTLKVCPEGKSARCEIAPKMIGNFRNECQICTTSTHALLFSSTAYNKPTCNCVEVTWKSSHRLTLRNLRNLSGTSLFLISFSISSTLRRPVGPSRPYASGRPASWTELPLCKPP